MPSGDDQRLRTIKDAARLLGVCRDTIYRRGHRGELETIKIANGTRVTQSSIDKYIANAKARKGWHGFAKRVYPIRK